MKFVSWNYFLKIQESIKTLIPKVGSLTLSNIPMSMKCNSRASLLARTFASLCFVHEPQN
jgi:hypothetical protein